MAVGDQKVRRDRAAVRKSIEVVRPDPEEAGVLEANAVAPLRDRLAAHRRGKLQGTHSGRYAMLQPGVVEQSDPAIGVGEIRDRGEPCARARPRGASSAAHPPEPE